MHKRDFKAGGTLNGQKIKKNNQEKDGLGGVVELVTTSACHVEGCEFESHRSRYFRLIFEISWLFSYILNTNLNGVENA